jgi:hypothetical protein
MVRQNQNFVTSGQHPCQARSTFRIPAVQAFLIQLIALPASLILVGVVSVLTERYVGILEVALLQGGVAALIARWRRLALWWIAIQLSFPCALIAVHSLELPPWIFLASFFFLLSIYWTTFQTQVPFYPSNPTAWEAVLDLLPQEASVRLIDIGSGMGGGVLYMAARQPKSVFVGIEVAPLPWLVSTIKGWLTRSSARFIRGNYLDLDLADYDVVFAYLSPVAMPALWGKVQREMRRGSLLLSYEFPIPTAPADTVIKLSEEDIALYAWHIQ